MSAIQVFLLYNSECPLLGRDPLLGASVNGELTVHSVCSTDEVFH